jgi:hypothetical protein
MYLIGQIQFCVDISVSQNTTGHIRKHMPAVKLITGVPMDRSRMMADLQAIHDVDTNVRALTIGVALALTVTMDEPGFTDDPDRRREMVVVPADDPGSEIPKPVHRSMRGKHFLQRLPPICTALAPLIGINHGARLSR